MRKVGKQVILEPANEWPPDVLASLGAWKEDIPRPRGRNKTIAKEKNPFDP